MIEVRSLANPQRTDTSNLERLQKQGYNIAYNYYKQRRRNIMRFLMEDYEKKYKKLTLTQLDQLSEALGGALQNRIIEEWNECVKALMSSEMVNSYNGQSRIKSVVNKGKIHDSELIALAKIFNIADDDKHTRMRSLINQVSGKNALNRFLGYLYEEFVADRFQKLIIQTDNSLEVLEEEMGQELIKGLAKNSDIRVVGKAGIRRNTAIRSKGADSSVDVGFNMLDKNGNLTTLAEAKVGGFINIVPFSSYISQRKNSGFNTSLEYQQEVLSEYVYHSEMFGFQTKKQNTTDYYMLPFKQSSTTKDQLNSRYKNDSPNKTWTGKQAYYFMTSFLATNLVTLLGPALLGVMFGDKFIFMDDFVKDYTFVHMLNQTKGITNKEAAITKQDFNKEIFPIINNKELYAASKKMSMTNILTINKWYKNFRRDEEVAEIQAVSNKS